MVVGIAGNQALRVLHTIAQFSDKKHVRFGPNKAYKFIISTHSVFEEGQVKLKNIYDWSSLMATVFIKNSSKSVTTE